MKYGIISTDKVIETYKTEQDLLAAIASYHPSMKYTAIRYEELEIETKITIKSKPVKRVAGSDSIWNYTNDVVFNR